MELDTGLNFFQGSQFETPSMDRRLLRTVDQSTGHPWDPSIETYIKNLRVEYDTSIYRHAILHVRNFH